MSDRSVQRVSFVDSHTAGEPTRVVISGGPELKGRTVAEKRDDFRDRFDMFRSAVVNEPRGSDVMVGALLVEPLGDSSAAGVIFFNNASVLGMCGHGTIGVVATLAYLGRLAPGKHRLETPVGDVVAELHESGEVSVENVPAYRYLKGVAVALDDGIQITGDVAWGGNWFFLCEDHGQRIALDNVEALTDFTWRVRQALERAEVTGRDGAVIDHIELFAHPADERLAAHADSQNFVLCPGKAYDRSPCGTGTSAKLACLYESGKLEEGAIWHQASILGGAFQGSIRRDGDMLIPTIQGRAYINAEGTLLLDPADPYCHGIRA